MFISSANQYGQSAFTAQAMQPTAPANTKESNNTSFTVSEDLLDQKREGMARLLAKAEDDKQFAQEMVETYRTTTDRPLFNLKEAFETPGGLEQMQEITDQFNEQASKVSAQREEIYSSMRADSHDDVTIVKALLEFNNSLPSDYRQTAGIIKVDTQPHSGDKSEELVSPGTRGVEVDISESGRSALEREIQNIEKARNNQGFLDFRGHDGKIRLGLFALGDHALDNWSAKGLELNEETVIAAAEAFQDAFREMNEEGESTAGASIVLNRHQIVINSQEVPDWFIEEHNSTLSSMENGPVSSAFKDGDTFFVASPTTPISEALNRYAEVKHNSLGNTYGI